MPELTKEDMKDAVRLGVLEAMEAHRKDEHLPLWRKVEKVERHQWYERGAFAGLVGLFELWKNK